MNCVKYPDRQAAGVCSYSGKPYCSEELVDVGGKLVAKENIASLLAEAKDQTKTSQPAQPIVFMNAGGSSSSAASTVSTPYAGLVAMKSKGAAALLALLLGGLGAHKFYLGKPIQGLIYLVFCWTFIPGIIGICEGIYYLVLNEHDWAIRFGRALRVA